MAKLLEARGVYHFVGTYMNFLTRARALYDDGRYFECSSETRRLLRLLKDESDRLRAMLLLASSEWELGRRDECLQIMVEAGSLLDNAPVQLKGKFYGQRALLYRNAGELDRSLIDYEEARFWARAARDLEVEARVRNNLAKVYSDLGRLDDALREVNCAIEIAVGLNETILAGRFTDMKAQILFAHRKYEQSLSTSVTSLNLLRGHPAESEARETHDKTFNQLAADYLRTDDPVEKFSLRRMIVKGLGGPIDAQLIQVALSRSDGIVKKAADLLNVKHTSLAEAIEKHKLQVRPKRQRAKPLITVK